MSRVPRWAWLAVAAGILVVVGLGLYVGAVIQDRHQGDNGRRLAALDHETSRAQIRQYRAAVAEQAAMCGEDPMYLAAAVVVAKQHRPEATAWGLLVGAHIENGLPCSTMLLYQGSGAGEAPTSLPAG